MFILRVIIKNSNQGSVGQDSFDYKDEMLETNLIIGDSYKLVTKADNPNDFNTFASQFFIEPSSQLDLHRENTYAFIIYNHGAGIRPLYRGQDNFIMTDTGKTFSRIVDR